MIQSLTCGVVSKKKIYLYLAIRKITERHRSPFRFLHNSLTARDQGYRVQNLPRRLTLQQTNSQLWHHRHLPHTFQPKNHHRHLLNTFQLVKIVNFSIPNQDLFDHCCSDAKSGELGELVCGNILPMVFMVKKPLCLVNHLNI